MASREREVRVTVLGEDRSGSKTLKGLSDQAGETEGKFGAAFGKMAVAAGGLFAGAKVLQFAGDMQGLGVELETMGKKAATVFEGSTGQVTAWASQNASAMGLTDDKLRSLAASFGDLLKPMGFTSAEAADMSTKVVGLSGALSAWSGGTRSAADVSAILAKAMLGERDGLKELGISISDADVKQRLMEKGQKDLTGAALQQATALATQELIFEKSADAQKAWADGSMDAVKKQNALKEKLAELREDIATKLAPVFASLVSFMVDTFIPGAERVAAVVGPVLATAFAVIAGAIPAVQAAFDGLLGVLGNPIFQIVAGVIGAVLVPALIMLAFQAGATAVALGVSYAVMAAQAIAATATTVAQFVIQGAQWVWMGITALASAAQVALAWLIALGPIALVVAAVIAAAVLIVANWDWIKETVGNVVGAIGGFLSNLIGWVVGFVQEWGVLLLGPIGMAWKFRDEIAGVVGAVIGFFGRLVGAVADKAGELIGWVAGIPGRVLGALGDLGGLLWNAGADLIWGMINGISAMAGRLANAAVNVARGAVNAVKGFLGIGSPSKLFEGLGINVGQGLVGGLGRSEDIVSRAGASLAAAAVPGVPGADLPALSLANAGSSAAAAGITVINHVAGSVVTERDLVEAVQAGLLQKQRRVPSLGLT
jgi:hypothetical protein